MTSVSTDPMTRYLVCPSEKGLANETIRLKDVYPSQYDAINSELKRLFKTQSANIVYGQVHRAACPAWRDERMLRSEESLPRFAVRVHVFEDTGKRTRKGEPDVGRYLGFVSLRPPEDGAPPSRRAKIGFQWVLHAELRAPRRMLRPRYHLVLSGGATYRLGVLPFRCSLFVAPGVGEIHRSKCLHTAISEALCLTMGRFGSLPFTERDFVARLWQEGTCGDIEKIMKRGAGFSDILLLLEKHRIAGGFIASFPESDFGDEKLLMKEALRCITDTLANGLPIISMVDYRMLWPNLCNGQPDPAYHASLLLGMHLLHDPYEIDFLGHKPCAEVREDEAELPGRLVGHDMLSGPYQEYSSDEFLKAAFAKRREAYQDSDDWKPGIYFLAIGPLNLRLGLHEVRKMTIRYSKEEASLQPVLSSYNKRFGGAPEDPGHWRYVIRLLRRAELLNLYFEQALARDDFGRRLERIGEDYVWCVEVRSPAPANPPDGKKALDHPPAFLFVWRSDQELLNPKDPSPLLALARWSPCEDQENNPTDMIVQFKETGEEVRLKYGRTSS